MGESKHDELVRLANEVGDRLAAEQAEAAARQSAAWREAEEKRLRLAQAAPLMLEALRAEEEARRVYNDWAPGDGLAQDRVARARAHADELRRAAIKAATGGEP